MIVRPGEDLAVTLFADVYYVYDSITAHPLHHRFEKESHVHLFENASKRRTRIEIENKSGKQNRDVVDGYLDETRLHYSFKHPTLLSFTIGRTEGQEWHLPSFDPGSEQKSLFKLKSVDIYSWTNESAIQLLNAIRRLLPQEHITILYEPITIPSHYNYQQSDSVIQNLENIKITDPLMGYCHRPSMNSVPSIPAPPLILTPNVCQYTSYTPLPYDPAAPPKPEKMSYREKTPPIDDGGINPLRAIVSSELGLFTEATTCLSPQDQCFSIPQSSNEATSQVKSPNSNLSFLNPSYNQQTLPPSVNPNHSNVPVTQYAIYPNSSGAPFILNTPSVYSSEFPKPLMTPNDSSKYQYLSNKIKFHPPNTAEFSPSHLANMKTIESEAISNCSKPIRATTARFEERASRLEKGVGSLLKKLEKKIG